MGKRGERSEIGVKVKQSEQTENGQTVEMNVSESDRMILFMEHEVLHHVHFHDREMC